MKILWFAALVIAGLFPFSVQSQILVTSQVSSSDDDAEEDLSDGSIDLTSSDLELAVEDNIWPISDDNQQIGIRFTSITIPQGANIVSAAIRFTTNETTSDPAVVIIYAQDINNATQFYAIDYNVTARTKTTASVTWSIPAWNNSDETGSTQTTPNLSALVQEVVDRPGWVSGNAMAFIIEGSGTRVAHAYDGNAALSPVLDITYTVSSTGVNDDPMSDIKPCITLCKNGILNITCSDGLQRNLEVFTLEGKKIFTGTVNGSEDVAIQNSNLYQGQILLVRLFLKNQSVVTKISVQ
jgi:hypothetical protein